MAVLAAAATFRLAASVAIRWSRQLMSFFLDDNMKHGNTHKGEREGEGLRVPRTQSDAAGE